MTEAEGHVDNKDEAILPFSAQPQALSYQQMVGVGATPVRILILSQCKFKSQAHARSMKKRVSASGAEC